MNIDEATRMRTFATFEGGDNVKSLGDEFLEVLADSVGVGIDDCYENPAQLITLAREIDELTDDGTLPAEGIPLDKAVDHVDRSGIMKLGIRGLLARAGQVTEGAAWVIDTSNANWLDIAVEDRLPIRKDPKIPRTIFVPGKRLMDREDEALNPHVITYKACHDGQPPTEEQFYNWFIGKRVFERRVEDKVDDILPGDGRRVRRRLGDVDKDIRPYVTLFEVRGDLQGEDAEFIAHGVGAASLSLACKLHIAGGLSWGGHFNDMPEFPSVIVAPQVLPLATTEAELRDPTKLSPYTALSSLATAAHWMIRAGVSRR